MRKAKMIDLNQIVNTEIMRERLQARDELAREILKTIGCPKNSSEYIDRTQEVTERLIKVRNEYVQFQSEIPF